MNRRRLKTHGRPLGGLRAASDFVLWGLAASLAWLIRYDFEIQPTELGAVIIFGLLMATVWAAAGFGSRLYNTNLRPASVEELVPLVTTTIIVSLTGTLALVVGAEYFELPRSLAAIASLNFLFLAGLVRLGERFSQRRKSGSSARRTLVYGAGSLAEIIVPQMLDSPNSAHLPVGLIDDDAAKRVKRISGLRVLGGFDQLQAIARSRRAEVIIVAFANAGSSFLQELYGICKELGLEVVVLPSFGQLVRGTTNLRALTPLSIEELIGRRPTQIDTAAIEDRVAGKRILVTGAGGSIGAELSRQIATMEPSQLVFLDRDETGIQQAQLVATGGGLLDNDDFAVTDIRDVESLRNVFEKFRPEIVFHAAALKHLPALEKYPEEAWKTNVLGTLNVLEASVRCGASTVINISTDKAADPTSFLGKSKLLAESLTAWYAKERNIEAVSVRFGNVLGSRGSLIPTVEKQIELGLPVVLTHPDATRYFMSLPEACLLVLQAMVLGDRGAVLILDMGEPVKVLDVVQKLFELKGESSPIIFSGLRPGEKVSEVLLSQGLSLQPTDHGAVSKCFPTPLNPTELDFHGFIGAPESARSNRGSS